MSIPATNLSELINSNKNQVNNYKELYNSLKSEYDQMQKDNTEICNEYEITIKLLSDSIIDLKSQKNSIAEKLSEITAEKESLFLKNKDKLIDIEKLNSKNEKLLKEIQEFLEKEKISQKKIIILENDNEYYKKIIRENEDVIKDLNTKLEDAIEESIILQNEYENYKQTMNELLTRKEYELKDLKNDIFYKNKNQIQKNINISIKKIQDKMSSAKNSLKKYQKKYNASSYSRDDTIKLNQNLLLTKNMENEKFISSIKKISNGIYGNNQLINNSLNKFEINNINKNTSFYLNKNSPENYNYKENSSYVILSSKNKLCSETVFDRDYKRVNIFSIDKFEDYNRDNDLSFTINEEDEENNSTNSSVSVLNESTKKEKETKGSFMKLLPIKNIFLNRLFYSRNLRK